MPQVEYATSLAAQHTEISRLWHPTRNGGLDPGGVMPASHRKIWWQCSRGHEWEAMPFSLLQGTGCPYCAGKRAIPGQTDLATLYPAVAAEWHLSKNGGLMPCDVGPGSMTKVWWRCERGHDYFAHVFSRVQGTGCPYCAGKKAWPGFNDLATLYPNLAREWHPELNGALTPREVTKGSHKQIWWQCPEGHTWKAMVFARAKPNGTGCPVCAGTTRRKEPKIG